MRSWIQHKVSQSSSYRILLRCRDGSTMNRWGGDLLWTPHVGTAITNWAPFQYPIRRLIVRSRKVSKPRDSRLELSDRSAIWQAPRQQGCRSACQISKRCDNFNYQSRGFETSRDLTIRRLSGYWNGALGRFSQMILFSGSGIRSLNI